VFCDPALNLTPSFLRSNYFSQTLKIKSFNYLRRLRVKNCLELGIIIIIIIFINCNWVVTRWQWLFYMYKNMKLVNLMHIGPCIISIFE